MNVKTKIEELLKSDQNWKISGTKKMADEANKTVNLKDLANSPKMRMLYKIDATKEALPKVLPKIAVLGLTATISIAAISNINDDVSNDISKFASDINHQVQDFAGIQRTPEISEIDYEKTPEQNANVETEKNQEENSNNYKIVETESDYNAEEIEDAADLLLSEFRSGSSIEEIKSKYIDEMDPLEQNALKDELRDRFRSGEISLSEGIEIKNRLSRLR